MTRPIRRVGGAILVALFTCVGVGCQEPPTDERLTPSAVPHFSIRGRQATSAGGIPTLSLRVDESDSPLAPGEFLDCMRTGIATWNQTGMVQIRIAAEGEPFNVLCGWRRLAHDDCPAFGQDTTVAHSGPVADSTFIHFDVDQEWTPDGSSGLPMTQVATHELGHVLGLGHSLDEAAVMHPNHDARRTVLTNSDRAGLAALYGTLPESNGDVWLRTPGGESTPILQRVAPAHSTELAAFDTDGDGRAELLLWRTDKEGLGQLMVYHFDEARRLERSDGPLIGCVVPETRTLFCTDTEGAGVLLSIRPDGQYSGRRFEASPVPKAIPSSVEIDFPEGYSDSNRDGVLDALPADLRLFGGVHLYSGDLDGDGRIEALERIP